MNTKTNQAQREERRAESVGNLSPAPLRMGTAELRPRPATTGGTVAAPLASVPPTTEFLKKRELAALLKVTERTLETWLREGRLPFIKVSKSVRFHWPTVLAHLNSKTQTRKTES